MFQPEIAGRDLIEREALALRTRVNGVRPFGLVVPMVPAAALAPAAYEAIEAQLLLGRARLQEQLGGFLDWLRGPGGRAAPAAEAQRRFTLLRLRFNAILSDLDELEDAVVQRAEHGVGVWLAGLDALAEDGLRLPVLVDPPPVVCYLDRGIGAAIRRARTRLPGGGPNPVAIVRVPRERMVGAGVASSLLHEVGHQAAALLDLLPPVRSAVAARSGGAAARDDVWRLWARWISEILADVWSIARLGIAAPLGMLAISSLPRAFVFQVNVEDPHPPPWIRMKLACELGHLLYPDARWPEMARTWGALYPRAGLEAAARLFDRLEATLPELAAQIVRHRPPRLGGRTLAEALTSPDRHPARLAPFARAARTRPQELFGLPPALALAAIGLARVDRSMSARQERELVSRLLSRWALARALHRPSLSVPLRSHRGLRAAIALDRIP